MRKTLLTAAALLCVAAPASAKLQSPIQGQISPEETKAKVGQTVSIAVTITTRKPFQEIEVAVKLPAGVTLAEGKAVDRILDFKAGEKKTFRYTVRVTKPGEQVVMVEAEAKQLGPHEGWGNTFVTVINPAPPR